MHIPWTNYSLILFDFDDTLVDFAHSERAAVKAVCENYGYESTDEGYATFHSINCALWHDFDAGRLSRNELFHRRFAHFFSEIKVNGDPDVANEIFLSALASEVSLISNAKNLLTYLSTRVVIGIVSNGHGPTQRKRAKRAGIDHLIHFSVISDDVGVGKPHRKMFDTAYQYSGLPTGLKTLMVGDNLKADIAGAQSVGFDTCWVSKGQESLTIVPTYKINGIQDLIIT